MPAVTPDEEAEHSAAADRALSGLWDIFANAPKPPAHIKYDLVVDENGTYRWAQNDIDLMIRKAMAAARKQERRPR
jgi:hypothetical protein